MENEDLLTFTSDIVSSYVANNRIAADDVGQLVQDVYRALSSVGETQEEPEAVEPAVSVRASIKPDHLVCLECGKNQKILKRHLMTAHNLTPEEYRERYGLKSDYPMIAPDYAERRRDLAKQIGLGRKKGEKLGPRKNGNGKAK
ncbi:MucR family transcriptional regulator [Altererythrobacter sp. SALINAS58]|uniref:MucR family transcriptional regulator n=1 Tax=Alteripontixanthobacter muriae TaxID=2705546 RepID=UPI0015763977|nr:MucR family transcriptional regulator [Alteripontixanthobacter muriae]NTZ42048.1 MucR family transcriptional regulator [Alteripontixanthobacter muriae]